jgi:hypothetical protein
MNSNLLRAFFRNAIAIGATALCLGFAAFVQSAAAQAVYQYKGNPFTLFSCGPTADGQATLDCSTPYPTNVYTSYTAADYVSATLSFTSALPANMAVQDVKALAGFQLTLRDQHQTLTMADAVGSLVEVGTNASGQISQWRLVINTGGLNNGGVATVSKGTSNFDQGVLACCDPTVSGNLALNFGSPGTWSAGAPSPAAAVTSLIGVVSNPVLNLTPGQVSSLTDKLNSALASIQAGLNKQAINQLSAFVSAVQTYQKNGKMSAQTATTLVTAANAIIAMLQL